MANALKQFYFTQIYYHYTFQNVLGVVRRTPLTIRSSGAAVFIIAILAHFRSITILITIPMKSQPYFTIRSTSKTLLQYIPIHKMHIGLIVGQNKNIYKHQIRTNTNFPLIQGNTAAIMIVQPIHIRSKLREPQTV